jgi:hypothetical protein
VLENLGNRPSIGSSPAAKPFALDAFETLKQLSAFLFHESHGLSEPGVHRSFLLSPEFIRGCGCSRSLFSVVRDERGNAA